MIQKNDTMRFDNLVSRVGVSLCIVLPLTISGFAQAPGLETKKLAQEPFAEKTAAPASEKKSQEADLIDIMGLWR